MSVQPSHSRGVPPFDQAAADSLRQAQGQPPPRYVPPQPEVSEEDRRLAEEAAQQDALICRYCLGVHKFPTTICCPRIASAELDGDGAIKSVTFWGPGQDWAKGRVALFEDLHEKGSGPAKGKRKKGGSNGR